jgi:hypothetical protein
MDTDKERPSWHTRSPGWKGVCHGLCKKACACHLKHPPHFALRITSFGRGETAEDGGLRGNAESENAEKLKLACGRGRPSEIRFALISRAKAKN